tara:strand:+ start:35 stop:208 length:174 start_codon:yes stop_codon:yes gene_type:complete
MTYNKTGMSRSPNLIFFDLINPILTAIKPITKLTSINNILNPLKEVGNKSGSLPISG